MAMTLSSERGMTMVELLVSSAVMLTVLSVTTTVMTKSSTMFTQQRAALDGRNSAAASVDLLTRLLRQSSCISATAVYCQSIFPDPDGNGVFDSVRVRADWNPRDGDLNDAYEDVVFVGGRRHPLETRAVRCRARVVRRSRRVAAIHLHQPERRPTGQSGRPAGPDRRRQRDHRDDGRAWAPLGDEYECDQFEEDQVNTSRIVVAARSERGVSMVFTLLSLAMVTVLGLGLTSVAMSTVSQAVAESETTEALAIADAGIEHGKQLVLWQDWQSLNVFLQRGDAQGCNYDELAGTPINIPLPAGYPTTAANFIPATGRAFGQGRYYVELCDNHSRESGGAGAVLRYDANTDVDKVIYMRSVGFGPRGSRAAVELTLGAAAMPAVVVEGNLEVKGNPTVTGPAGSIHANGTLELSGNPCTHVYYASVGGTTESGNVQGGTGCTAADVDSRPFSPRLNIPKLDPFTVARQAQAAGVTVYER